MRLDRPLFVCLFFCFFFSFIYVLGGKGASIREGGSKVASVVELLELESIYQQHMMTSTHLLTHLTRMRGYQSIIFLSGGKSVEWRDEGDGSIGPDLGDRMVERPFKPGGTGYGHRCLTQKLQV